MKINNIKEINDLIKEMDKRLELFIGSRDIGKLSCFLDGFIYSKDIYEIRLTESEKSFQRNFYKWIKEYYSLPDTSVSWVNIILSSSGDNHSQAIETFFKLYKQWYKKEFGEVAW